MRDFPDWISPMLVKELRQGLRSRVFISAFLIVQALLVFNALIGMLTVADNNRPDFSNGFFWFLFVLPVLGILPLSGFTALDSERKANTLDLIFLTKLTAWRLLLGKWVALMAQILLLATTILPYTVLRYFLGGVNLGTDFTVIAAVLAGSAVFSAFTVGVSPFQNKITRVLFTIGFLWFGTTGVFWILAMFVFGGHMGSSTSKSTGMLWMFVALSLPIIMALLRLGATKISPVAENHATMKRIMGIAILLIAVVSSLITYDSQVAVLFCSFLVGLVCLDALCEEPRMVPSIYMPFAKRGFPGRFASALLTPGWVSGFWFSIVMLAGMMLVLFIETIVSSPMSSSDKERFIGGMIALGATVFALPGMVRLFAPRTENALGHAIWILVACGMLAILATAAAESTKLPTREIFSAIPPVALFIVFFVNSSQVPPIATIAGIAGCVFLLILFLRRMPQRREIKAVWQEARQELVKHADAV